MPYADPEKRREAGRERSRRYREQHPGRQAEATRRWRENPENRKKDRAAVARWRAENPEKVRAQEERRMSDPVRGPKKREQARLYQQKYRKANADEIKARRDQRMADPEYRRRKNEIASGWQRRNPEKVLDNFLRRTYGITLKQYNQLLEVQGGRCSICDKPPAKKRLHVDHCHETNRVRGLLCTKCNTGLGLFIHSDKLLQRAMVYLNETTPLEYLT